MGESDGYEEEVAFEERRRGSFNEDQVSVVTSVTMQHYRSLACNFFLFNFHTESKLNECTNSYMTEITHISLCRCWGGKNIEKEKKVYYISICVLKDNLVGKHLINQTIVQIWTVGEKD